MKKVLILIIFLFLLTGCSVKYNLVINEDLSITEEAKLTGTNDFFADYYKTTKTNVIKSYLDIYDEVLKENNYDYELVKDTIPYADVKRKYNNVSDYTKKSIFIKDYFEEVKYSEDGNIKKIETSGYIKGNKETQEDRFYLSELSISINCPYKVTKHNAKNVDKKTNTYYYELSDGDKIVFEYDTSSKFNPNADLIRTIIICVLVIIGLWTIIIVLSKKNKNMI